MNYSSKPIRRFRRSSVAKEGDFVILCAARTAFYGVKLEKNKVLDCKYGHFHHNVIIGKPFGSFVDSIVSLKKYINNKTK